METENGRPSASLGPFRVLEHTADGHRVIAPHGELDLLTTPQLEERLAGTSNTVLDLSELSFIDSTGIHLIVSTVRRAESEAWDFSVRNPQPDVLRVIKLVGLAEHLGLEGQIRPQADAEPPSPRT
jgi:anti-sigma B factor antagonist